MITVDALCVPLTIELIVTPVSELRLASAAHNRFIALDDHGRVVDRTPWFTRTAAQRGVAIGDDPPFIGADWARVTFAIGDEERKLYINGELRHAWREDYSGVRSRIEIGVQRSEITIRSLTVRPV